MLNERKLKRYEHLKNKTNGIKDYYLKKVVVVGEYSQKKSFNV